MMTRHLKMFGIIEPKASNRANVLGWQEAPLVPHSAFAAGDLRIFALKRTLAK
jgi:hypothetical protein